MQEQSVLVLLAEVKRLKLKADGSLQRYKANRNAVVYQLNPEKAKALIFVKMDDKILHLLTVTKADEGIPDGATL